MLSRIRVVQAIDLYRWSSEPEIETHIACYPIDASFGSALPEPIVSCIGALVVVLCYPARPALEAGIRQIVVPPVEISIDT